MIVLVYVSVFYCYVLDGGIYVYIGQYSMVNEYVVLDNNEQYKNENKQQIQLKVIKQIEISGQNDESLILFFSFCFLFFLFFVFK